MSEVRPVTAELLQEFPLPQPEHDTDKNSRGTVLIAGGSATSAGAVMLAGEAAFRAGAGKVHLVVPQSLATAMAVGFPEAGVHAFAAGSTGAEIDSRVAGRQVADLLDGVDAALIGPGFTNESIAQQLASSVLESIGPAFVIDAMSLTGLWREQQKLARHRGRLVITPHVGEMARLTGIPAQQIHADPAHIARQAAIHLHCVVVLKGATTVIAAPDGPLYVHAASIAGLATSGAGDVLAGVLAGLLARGVSAVEAALWSVFLHAQAGRCLAERIGPLGLLARELPAQIPPLMRDLAAAGTRGPQT